MIVLDSSALLAVSFQEPGADLVRPRLAASCMSTVNMAESLSRLVGRGATIEAATAVLRATPIQWVELNQTQAEIAAGLLPATRPFGLSLGDRCCLALALERRLPVLTADRAWSRLDIGVDIALIR